MKLHNSQQPKANKVMGIDCSTNSLAFGVIEDGELVRFGEIFFEGKDLYERLVDARLKISELVSQNYFDADFIAFEKAVLVRSVTTVIKLAYMFGIVMSLLLERRAKVVEVTPIEWQSGIGNKNLNKAEKAAIKLEHPGKSTAWFQAYSREMRKQRTLTFVNTLHGQAPITSDNVGDACGIAWYAYNKMTERK